MPNARPREPFAKRSLGQNFLVDQQIVDRIVEALGADRNDRVLEIGPGRGALTALLLDRAGMAYAIEFDRTLIRYLDGRFGDRSNFELIEEDALSFDFRDLVSNGGRLKLVANLPYNISTAILQRLFDYPDVFADCVLMFQREVVERITAEPGNRERGYLTVLNEAHFTTERLFDVSPSAFRPVPKVWSSVVRLRPRSDLTIDYRLREIVSIGFAQKRKTIYNNLKIKYPDAAEMLDAAGVDARRRAETLTLDEWLRLVDAVSPNY